MVKRHDAPGKLNTFAVMGKSKRTQYQCNKYKERSNYGTRNHWVTNQR
jgi:hypothetical protein